MNIHMHIIYFCNRISQKGDHEAEEEQEGLKGGKGRNKCSNYIIISKF